MDSTPEFLRAKYESVELIGEGGDGRVYKCQRGERVTAVKTLVALDLASQTRFLSEADILLQIDHENIVKVFEAGKTDGCFWYESEHANEGHFGTMHGYILQSDLDRANYFGQICLGVQALHNLNPPIIHRDLKPRNILVFSNAEPRKRTVLKIADFGLAVIAGEEGGLTTTGDALGTGDYMAPECKANPLIRSPRSDIYSLGITFLEACTGKTDVSQENLNLVPELFRPMIGKMIQQHPNHRYQSVVEVIDALRGFSFLRLLYGRELLENEVGTPVFHINIGRELENALGTFFTCDSSNVLERLAFLERLLDRLYDASDHEAHTIITIPRNGVALTDQVKPDALLSLVRRFINATENTRPGDFFPPEPDRWARFLFETFHLSSYRPTKCLCLEGLAKLLNTFSTPWIKEYIYRTFESLEDPSYMEHFATCLREVNRPDLAILFDGVPDRHTLDLVSLRTALQELGT